MAIAFFVSIFLSISCSFAPLLNCSFYAISSFCFAFLSSFIHPFFYSFIHFFPSSIIHFRPFPFSNIPPAPNQCAAQPLSPSVPKVPSFSSPFHHHQFSFSGPVPVASLPPLSWGF